jgi:hypothetical protein
VPHRTPAAQTKQAGLKGVIAASYLDQLAADNPKLFAPPPLGPSPEDKAKVREGIKAEVDRVAGAAAELLWAGACLKCHDATTAGEVKTPAAHPPWLPKAKFSHTPHQQQACASCHPGTTAAAFTVEKEAVAANITDLGGCKTCHAAKAEGGTGVRHGCTDCHGYHHK